MPGAPEEPAAPAPLPDVSPEKIFESIGWIIGNRNNLAEFGMSDTEFAALQKGMTAAMNGEPPPAGFQDAQKVVQQFLTQRVEEREQRLGTENRAEEEAEMARLDQDASVQKTDSGLRYQVIEPGAGPKPTLQDTVVAHYTLSFPDGSVRESTRDSGEPAEFPLGNVIPAWQEGLQLIGKGGKIKLYVPSELGYGAHGSPGGIPPAKMLVFDVELVDVKPAPPQAPASPQPAATP